MSYRRYELVEKVDDNGKKVKKGLQSRHAQTEPVTLGMLATMRSWQNNEDKGLPYPLIRYKFKARKGHLRR